MRLYEKWIQNFICYIPHTFGLQIILEAKSKSKVARNLLGKPRAAENAPGRFSEAFSSQRGSFQRSAARFQGVQWLVVESWPLKAER